MLGARCGRSTGTSAGATRSTTSSAACAARGCELPEIWITETGVGAPRAGEERRTSPASQVRACGRLHRRLVRWYRDPRVTAAFQYTFREDDLFPTGLIKTDLSSAYPALGGVDGLGRDAPADRPAAGEPVLSSQCP